VIQVIDRTVEQIRGSAAMAHVKGQTEHQCQVQFIPLLGQPEQIAAEHSCALLQTRDRARGSIEAAIC
jgi:hypothetical protein